MNSHQAALSAQMNVGGSGVGVGVGGVHLCALGGGKQKGAGVGVGVGGQAENTTNRPPDMYDRLQSEMDSVHTNTGGHVINNSRKIVTTTTTTTTKNTSPGQSLTRPPSVRPSKAVANGTASHLFNRSNSTSQIPRKGTTAPSDNATVVMTSPSKSIPKKRKFQRQDSSQDSQTANAPIITHTSSSTKGFVRSNSNQGLMRSNSNQNIQSQQTNQKEQIRVTYNKGQWRRRAVARAPKAGETAMPLGGDRKGRLVGKKNSMFSPNRDGGGATEDDSIHGDGESSRGSNSYSSPEKRVENRRPVASPRTAAMAPPVVAATGAVDATLGPPDDDGLNDTDSDSSDSKLPAKKKPKVTREKDALGLEDTSSAASSSESDDEGDNDSSDDNLPMAKARKKRNNNGSAAKNRETRLQQNEKGERVNGGCDDLEEDRSDENNSDADMDNKNDKTETIMGNNNNDDNNNNDEEGSGNTIMELDDTMAIEFEQDFFNLIEQNIRVNENWRNRTATLSFGRQALPSGAAEGSQIVAGETNTTAEETNYEAAQPIETNESTNDEHSVSTMQADTDSSLKENMDIMDEEPPKEQRREKKKKQKKRRRVREDNDNSHNRNNQVIGDDWTSEEKRRYREGYELHPNDWGQIASHFVKSKSVHKIREYARMLARDNPRENPQDSELHDAESTEESTFSGTAATSSGGDDENDFPVFLTCNKCSMVFGEAEEAWTHEVNCTGVRQSGRVYHNQDDLVQFMLEYWQQEGKVPTESDMIYFLPNESVIEGPINKASGGKDDTQRPSEERGGNGGNNSDVGESTDDEDEENEAADMNQVKHLCSTTVDPATGLPVQKLTIICGESGKRMMAH